MLDKRNLLNSGSYAKFEDGRRTTFDGVRNVEFDRKTSMGTFHDLPIQPDQIIAHPKVEPLPDGQRGIITSAEVTINSNGSFSVGGPVSSALLRQYALFFDQIDIPSNNLLELGGESPDIEYLKSVGVLRRTRTILQGRFDGPSAILGAQKITLEALDEKNPGAWSLAQSVDSTAFSSADLENDRGILISLYDSILTPNKDVHFDDLLEFKQARVSELRSLRYHLDEVYQRIISSPDSDLSKLSEIEQLKEALGDYNQSISESKFSLSPSTLSANFSFSKAVVYATGAFATGVELPVIGIAGLVGFMDIRGSKGLRRERSQKTPFKYVSSIRSDLF